MNRDVSHYRVPISYTNKMIEFTEPRSLRGHNKLGFRKSNDTLCAGHVNLQQRRLVPSWMPSARLSYVPRAMSNSYAGIFAQKIDLDADPIWFILVMAIVWSIEFFWKHWFYWCLYLPTFREYSTTRQSFNDVLFSRDSTRRIVSWVRTIVHQHIAARRAPCF